MDMTTYAVLLHKLKGVISGVKNVKLIEPRTLEFEAQDGQKFPITLPTPDVVWVGDDAPTDPQYELWIDTSDEGTTPIGKAILSDKIVSGISIGSVVPGTTFNVGESLEDVIRAMLTLNTPPKVTIGLSPTTTIYNVIEETLPKLTISANIVKGSAPITKLRYLIDNQVVHIIEDSSIAEGGVIKYTVEFNPPKNKTLTVKAEATDANDKTGSSMTTITFTGVTFYGTLDDEVEINEENIKTLDSELKNKVAGKYTFSTELGRFVYATPTDIGTVTSAKDVENSFNYTDSCTKTKMKINGLDYNVWYLTDSMIYDGLTITFA